MVKHIVVLGAGFGGLEFVTRLSEAVPEKVRITLIDKNDSFVFGFSKLDVMIGRKTVAEVRRAYREIAKQGVEFRQETVVSIDPANRRVVTDAATHEADILVIALGADYDIPATPGLAEDGIEFYSVAGATRAREALAAFGGGAVVVAVLGTFFKCPGAPNEAALLVAEYLSSRGLRDSSTIHLVSPLPAPVPVSKKTSAAIQVILEERGIEYWPSSRVIQLDPERHVAHLEDGRELAYDLFLGIPVHCAPEVVLASELAENGWIPVDPATFATKFPGVFAVGDVTSAPVPRAGGIAEGEAATVAEVLIAELTGGAKPAPYDGASACYVELGGDLVARIDVNFLSYDTPVAKLSGPTAEFGEEKIRWGSTRAARWFGEEVTAAAALPALAGLRHNRALIDDPTAFARDADAKSWLYLCGAAFASMDGGMSYADVRQAVETSTNIVSDPPIVMDMNLARQHIAALDELPRPTLVTCRTGPRSSAVIYLYAGLKAGANAGEVLAQADADGAPFVNSDELVAWVKQGLAELA